MWRTRRSRRPGRMAPTRYAGGRSRSAECRAASRSTTGTRRTTRRWRWCRCHRRTARGSRRRVRCRRPTPAGRRASVTTGGSGPVTASKVGANAAASWSASGGPDVVVGASVSTTSVVGAGDGSVTSAATVVSVGSEVDAATVCAGVAPMGTGSVSPAIELSWFRGGVQQNFPFAATGRPFGAFPIGVWGPPQDDDNRKTPKGDVVEALNELDLVARATESPRRAGDPLPPGRDRTSASRCRSPGARSTRPASATRARRWPALVPEPATVDAAFATAGRLLADSTSPTGARRAARRAPVAASLRDARRGAERRRGLRDPRHRGEAGAGCRRHVRRTRPSPSACSAPRASRTRLRPPRGTTVKDSRRLWRTPPPTMAGGRADAQPLDRGAARAARRGRPARRAWAGRSVATGEVPPTAVARAAPAAVAHARRGGAATGSRRSPRRCPPRGASRRPPGRPARSWPRARSSCCACRTPLATCGDGPRPRLGVRGGSAARLVALRQRRRGARRPRCWAGRQPSRSAWTVARGTERLAVDRPRPRRRARGRPRRLARRRCSCPTSAGRPRSARAARCARSAARSRATASAPTPAGSAGAELTAGLSTVTTRFARPCHDRGGRARRSRRRSAARRRAPPRCSGSTAPRARPTPAGEERPPVLLSAENRNVLAYDVVPDRGPRPVTVTVASEEGWSLAGVLGAAGATARVGARRRSPSAASTPSLRPIVPGRARAGVATRLDWLGESRAQTRPGGERADATAQARPLRPALERPAAGDGRRLRAASATRPGTPFDVARGADPRHASARRGTRCRPTRSCRASRRPTPRAPSATGCRRSCSSGARCRGSATRPAAATVSATPWLALVVVAEGEAELSTPTPVAQCVTAGTRAARPRATGTSSRASTSRSPRPCVRKIFPCAGGPAAAHPRPRGRRPATPSWPTATTTAGSPSCSPTGCRCSTPPATSRCATMACLVNLEGQLARCRRPATPVDFFEFELAQDWTRARDRRPRPGRHVRVTGIGARARARRGAGRRSTPGRRPSAPRAAAPTIGADRRRHGAALDGAAAMTRGAAARSGPARGDRRRRPFAARRRRQASSATRWRIGFRYPISSSSPPSRCCASRCSPTGRSPPTRAPRSRR